MDVTHEEFPADWFEGLADDQYRGRRYQIPRNKYGVRLQAWATAAFYCARWFTPPSGDDQEPVIMPETVGVSCG